MNGTAGAAHQSTESGDVLALDLTMVKRKLQDEDEGQGWSPYTCDAVEIEYKRFLTLKRLYPEHEIVPNRLIDLFWHQHILDTERYASDCQELFGHFVHHYPYFGMQGEEDHQNLVAAFSETSRLYKQHFGEDYDEASAKCRTKCKPMKCK